MLTKSLVAAILLYATARAWSLPGLTPKDYEKGKKLDIFVGQLFSDRTSFTFDYYSLNWCLNTKGVGYNIDKYATTQTGAPMHETVFDY